MNIIKGGMILALLVAAVYPLGADGETLDRLFFTPQERLYLEQLRWAPPEALAPVLKKAEAEAVPEEKPAFVTMSGMVKRGTQVRAVWLNGISRSPKELPENVRINPQGVGGQINVQVPEKGKSYPLRSGQTLEVDSGRIRESYEQQGTATEDGARAKEAPDQP